MKERVYTKSKYCAGNKHSEGAVYKQVRYAAARTAEHRRIFVEKAVRRKTNWPATGERSLETVKIVQKDKKAKHCLGYVKKDQSDSLTHAPEAWEGKKTNDI